MSAAYRVRHARREDAERIAAVHVESIRSLGAIAYGPAIIAE